MGYFPQIHFLLKSKWALYRLLLFKFPLLFSPLHPLAFFHLPSLHTIFLVAGLRSTSSLSQLRFWYGAYLRYPFLGTQEELLRSSLITNPCSSHRSLPRQSNWHELTAFYRYLYVFHNLLEHPEIKLHQPVDSCKNGLAPEIIGANLLSTSKFFLRLLVHKDSSKLFVFINCLPSHFSSNTHDSKDLNH